MAAFDYVVLDEKGRQKKGTLEGDSARQVRQQLRDKGLTPLSVEQTGEQVSSSEKTATQSFSRKSISSSDLALVTRQLATLIQAGLPVEETLRAVSKQSEKPKIASMMLAIRSKVVEGHTLAQSLAIYPNAFPHLYRATVAAGEHSGHLDLVLEQLADYTESSHDTAKKIQGAMIYPVVLTLFSLLIVIGLIRFVIPKMQNVFESSGQELPALTQGLINLSQFLQDYGLFLLLVIIALGIAFSRALRNDAFRYRMHSLILRLPLLSKMSRGVNSARVASTLSILSASGVQLVDALRIAGEVASNWLIRDAVVEAATSLREGSSLHKSLDHCGWFPPMMIQMIAAGENSGELDSMLARAARTQERELEGLISTLVSLFEPLMMIFMGLVILVIVSSIMMPIISMNNLVG